MSLHSGAHIAHSILVAQCLFHARIARRLGLFAPSLDETAPPPPRCKIGIIGLGGVGTLLADALLTHTDGDIEPRDIFVSSRSSRGFARLKAAGLFADFDNVRVFEECNIVFVCVLPSQVQALAAEVAGSVRANTLIVSLCCGMLQEKLAALFKVPQNQILRIQASPEHVQAFQHQPEVSLRQGTPLPVKDLVAIGLLVPPLSFARFQQLAQSLVCLLEHPDMNKYVKRSNAPEPSHALIKLGNSQLGMMMEEVLGSRFGVRLPLPELQLLPSDAFGPGGTRRSDAEVLEIMERRRAEEYAMALFKAYFIKLLYVPPPEGTEEGEDQAQHSRTVSRVVTMDKGKGAKQTDAGILDLFEKLVLREGAS